jgi:hypothetical protein
MLPACVQVCSTGALTIAPVDQLATQKADKAALDILKSVKGSL